MPSEKILVVEDDPKMLKAITTLLQKQGYEVTSSVDGESALIQAEQGEFDLAIVDLKLPGIDGLEVLKHLRKMDKTVSVIMMTAYATIDSAVEAMKEGAQDYLPKPFNLEEIRIVVRKVLERHELLLKNKYLQGQLKGRYKFGNIIGESTKIKEVLEIIGKVAASKSTILVYGETGTGKELVARAIHFNSSRADNVFLPVNCGALSENLLESELFGHVKGAFTGAVSNKRGVFEVADKGTIFLDEVGDISQGLQQKLLRVLEEGEVQPVGSTNRKKVDVRVIAATNKNLEEMVKNGSFREDLFFRLSVVPIEIPPLREHKEDIILLAQHFLGIFCKENHKPIQSISNEAMEILTGYDWPGNVRELSNVIERAVLLEESETLEQECLPDRLKISESAEAQIEVEDLQTLEDVSRNYIKQVLEATDGNKSKAAKILGINRTSLWRMMRRLKLDTD
ncbi:MAG: sigma-54-dependent Fis family transcriptional regulator [Planctomycetota bacterium]|nr:MAG: sigma-54-dependent Fis family transcriptional regulator [Planctomycetota bacterium]